jgi:hypothetical protein
MRCFIAVTLLLFSQIVLAWPTNSRNDGFNELFITSLIVNQKQAELQQYFPNSAYLRGPNAANLTWGDINHWVYRISSGNSNRGSAKLLRDIVHIGYLEPQKNTHPFDAQIASVLQIYQTQGMKVILAFGASGANPNDEPAWITADVNSKPQPEQLYRRKDIYVDVISRFIKRMHDRGLDRPWLLNNVRIEPLNEVNANLSGYPLIAALLDLGVQQKLAQLNIPHEVVASSIISGWPCDYMQWFSGYYAANGPGMPNIHLYMNEYDAESYGAMIQRFRSTIKMFAERKEGPHAGKVIVGEIGHARGDPRAGAFHDYVMDKFLDDAAIRANVESLALWRFLGAYIGVSCYNYPGSCGLEQRVDTTFGFVRLATDGGGGRAPPTPLQVEEQARIHFGILP